MSQLRPLFLGHGAPTLATGASAARAHLESLAADTSPRAYAVVSAHWEATPVGVTASPTPETVHDFWGFGPELEAMTYPAPGDPELAGEIVRQLAAAGIDAVADARRGLDHGVWIPLSLMRPNADTPVVQIALPAGGDAADAARLGRALAPLADHGVQIVGSGSLTHSLRDSLRTPEDAPVANFARDFADWAAARLAAGDLDALLDWRSAPQAARNHPTPEHFTPLIAALSAGDLRQAERRHASFTHGALAMDVWAF